MKALSLTQPWAQLVALGQKKIETRSWSTPHRGLLAIHAAKGFPKWARLCCADEPFRNALEGAAPETLPLGAIVATCKLLACIRMEDLTQRILDRHGFELTDQEQEFGDYGPGRFAWLLYDVNRIDPVPATGALGLWEWRQ